MRTRLTALAGALAALALVAATPGISPRASAAPAPADLASVADLTGQRVLAAVADLDAPPRATGWLAGEAVGLTGTVGVYDVATGETVPSALPVQVRVDGDADRAVDVVARPDGVFTAQVPGALTKGLAPGVHALTVHAAPAAGLDRAEATAATFAVVATVDGEAVLRHQFVSSTGWVKPGQDFPLTSHVLNTGPEPLTDVTVTVAAPGSVTFTGAEALGGVGTVDVTPTTVTWTIPSVPAASEDAPGEVTLVTDARAADLSTDPRLVWKDLSSTATMTVAGEQVAETSHGPKVIPPSGGFETARYGDKPFPMVPVEYVDRAPQHGHDPAELDTIVNSPDFEGSTFNLYQEMSFGQLVPEGRGALGRHRLGDLLRRDGRGGHAVHRARARRWHVPRRHGRLHPRRHRLAGVRHPDHGRLVPASGHHRVLRRGLPGLHAGHGRGDRLGLRADRQGRVRRRVRRRPGDRLQPVRLRPRRRRRLLHADLRRLRRQRRLPGARTRDAGHQRAVPLHRRPVRQHLAALVVAGDAVPRRGDRPARLHLLRPAAIAHRGPAVLRGRDLHDLRRLRRERR